MGRTVAILIRHHICHSFLRFIGHLYSFIRHSLRQLGFIFKAGFEILKFKRRKSMGLNGIFDWLVIN